MHKYCNSPLRCAARFLKQETSDDSDLDLPSFHRFEGGVGENRIESLLGLDTRLSQVDRDFLLCFFESLGLAAVWWCLVSATESQASS